MAEEQRLSRLAARYLELTQSLARNKDSPPPETVLDCLVSRDRLAYVFKEEGPAEPEAARLIVEGDRRLRAVAGPIGQMPELKNWRESFNPPPEAWWWYFPAPESPPGFFERFDWLWTALALACLTVSLSLVADISPRFLSGGPDTWGAFAVIAQSALTLLTTSSVLTSAGREGARRILRDFKLPRRLWEEAGAVAAALLLLALFIFHRSLPQIARWYNDSGLDNYRAGALTSARRDYERALKLDPDLLQAHYNLALLYEDLSDLDQARAEYQIAVQGGLDVGYNNLARLYVLDGEYNQAVPLLLEGLKRAPDAAVRYDLYKNLGWARLGQGRYEEALAALQQAIELADDRAPAHCLLAQVLEAQGKDAEGAWEACLRYGDSSRPDEDAWLGLARQHFKDQSDQQGGE